MITTTQQRGCALAFCPCSQTTRQRSVALALIGPHRDPSSHYPYPLPSMRIPHSDRGTLRWPFHHVTRSCPSGVDLCHSMTNSSLRTASLTSLAISAYFFSLSAIPPSLSRARGHALRGSNSARRWPFLVGINTTRMAETELEGAGAKDRSAKSANRGWCSVRWRGQLRL
ncbi:hypothetical protein OG21DRAFT_664050 [Imleria badia]|nr:hypothetical protein OG21DRAFT_664050 [Imleria badia]